jgi:hypothetical protein
MAVERARRESKNGQDGEPFVNAEMRAREAEPEAILVGLDEIEPEPVSWLWKYFIALGKLHIIAGAPGDGKTTILLSLGERPQKDVLAAALAEGISEKTLRRAAIGAEIGKGKEKGRPDGAWAWWLA